MRKVISQTYLWSLLKYDPVTGLFRWRSRENDRCGWNARYANAVAGSLKKTGYVRIKIDGRLYNAHRLAWLYVYGEWPGRLDHKDTNKANNSIGNLRPATHSQNLANTGLHKSNTSGFKGVVWNKNRWRANITVGGRRIHLGAFFSRECAALAYAKAAEKYFGEFARTA